MHQGRKARAAIDNIAKTDNPLYAIDWIRRRGPYPLPDKTTRLTDFSAYGERVLSVADSKVVKAVDGYPDLEPGVLDST